MLPSQRMTGLHSDPDVRDAATGAYNQRYFAERVSAELASHQGQLRSPISIVRFDIDDFEGVSAAYGRQVGGAVLRVVVESARRVLQHDDVLARCDAGGFAIFVRGTSARNTAILA